VALRTGEVDVRYHASYLVVFPDGRSLVAFSPEQWFPLHLTDPWSERVVPVSVLSGCSH